jgi:hypothetical protein
MPERSKLTTRRSPAPGGIADPVAAPARAAVVFGLLAHLPIALFVLLEVWVGWSQHLWVGVREDLLVYGAAGIGPLLGCFAILLGRSGCGRNGAGAIFAQAAGWLSLATGVVIAYLARGLGGPRLLWSPLLLALMLLVVSERDDPPP